MSTVPVRHRALTERPEFRYSGPPKRLVETLGEYSQGRALGLFRSGLDTFEIARELQCTQAAAANGLAKARERERGL